MNSELLKILLGRWPMAIFLIGAFTIFLPGLITAMTISRKIGEWLMAFYAVPVIVWSLLITFVLMINFFKSEF